MSYKQNLLSIVLLPFLAIVFACVMTFIITGILYRCVESILWNQKTKSIVLFFTGAPGAPSMNGGSSHNGVVK